MIGATLLRQSTYEDIEHDPFASFQAFQVVLMAALATALGLAASGQGVIVSGAIVVFARWVLVAMAILIIGQWMFPGPKTETSLTELMRTTGFAHTPLMLTLFLPVPILGVILWWLSQLWSFAALVVAARQALDYRSFWPAMTVVSLALLPPLIIFFFR